MSDSFQKPLKADEIEALLRTARSLEPSRADLVSNEPMGPGDVQHLRNTAFDESPITDTTWPFDVSSADELLNRAEHHLAAALSPDIGLPGFDPRPATAPLLPPLTPAPAVSSGGLPLSVIGDLEVDVTLELGRADLMIEDLLALREGSVVTLNKDAAEPIDILANGKLVARGEVIVIDDKFCVRICELIGSR